MLTTITWSYNVIIFDRTKRRETFRMEKSWLPRYAPRPHSTPGSPT
jgi:hypothetical protein